MNCIVRKMELPEIEIAMHLAYKEGWNPGLNDGIAFYNTDPHGFLLAEYKGRVVGTISSVNYGDGFGFIGFYIVDSDYRGTVVGTQLGMAALNYLKDLNIGIDGVVARVENYKRLGFKEAYKNIRFEGIGDKFIVEPEVVHTKIIDFQEIADYDARCFPVRREKFLKGWLEMINSHSYVFYEENRVKGYGVIRSCRKGYKIGPLFADDIHIAEQLYKALANKAADELIYFDTPEANLFAVDLAHKYEMKKVFETARMYTGEEPLIDLPKIFGVTSFELG
ncbi:MAG: GNAT family N-acetyltransferase [Candidatus Kapabacteria bacterium]|nr:GNAT family N-acetyltransferase [Candidatus Kapabacteria bacterium]